MTPAAALRDVSVSYGRQPALSGVSLDLPLGAVGLLGPNGAGKSTLIRTLLGFTTPAHGSLRVLGRDPVSEPLEVRARIGYMPEQAVFVHEMTAVGFVAYCAELSGLPSPNAMQRASEVLFYVGLGEARYRPVTTFSTGMMQRVKLAQAIVHDPDLLLLDEPTNGLDPHGREEMLTLIRDLAGQRGIGVVMSSHLLPDVESTCDSVIVLDAGRVVAHGQIADLKQATGSAYEVRVRGTTTNVGSFEDALRRHGISSESSGDMLRIVVPAGTELRMVFGAAVDADVQIRYLRAREQTLGDIFARAVHQAS